MSLGIKGKDRLIVYKKTNGRCWYCGKQTNVRDRYILSVLADSERYDNHIKQDGFSIDHINPRSKGGTDDVNNLVPCCRHCNAMKHKRGIEDIRRHIWDEKFEEKFGVRFDVKQKEFLRSMGMDLSILVDNVKLYFEMLGEEINER